MRVLTDVWQSAAFYPITLLYLGGTTLLILVAGGYVNLAFALLAMVLLVLLVLLLATRRELQAVHRLVNGQHSDLLDRIDQLTELLVHLDVDVPVDPNTQSTRHADGTRKGTT